MAGLYLHIPFCRQACHYCDFHFSTNQKNRWELVEGMAEELALQKDYLDREPLSTIYFGGGTPSILEKSEMSLLFDRIRAEYTVQSSAEITVEANPDDLTDKKLDELKELGVNRLSIGIESFDDDVLKFMNRVHSAGEAVESMARARRAGFNNITIDLMYSVPGQTLTRWGDNIRRALDLSPEHISAYSLTIENRTAFGKWQREGKLHPVEENLSADEFELLMDQLSLAGYDHYEISNFSKPGFHSRHNSSYWEQQHYLGIGPSAHSFNGGTRQFNISNNAAYVSAIKAGRIPMELEVLTRENRINEYIFTTLRTSRGSNLAKLQSELQFDLLSYSQESLQMYLERNLVVVEGDLLRLTQAGKLLADQIASDLFADPPVD